MVRVKFETWSRVWHKDCHRLEDARSLAASMCARWTHPISATVSVGGVEVVEYHNNRVINARY